jgi:dienelactone hydrolase
MYCVNTMKANPARLRVWSLCVLFGVAAPAWGVGPPAQPSQPESGPGGRRRSHERVTVQTFGEGADQCWVFLPDSPRPKEAPVVVFLHGWGDMNPKAYGAWIRHLVRRGQIVVFPRFQVGLRTPVDEMTPNALRAVQAAWNRLEQKGPVRPRAGQLAVVGYSIGGFVAADLAAAAPQNGLPAPGALMVVHPANGEQWMRNPRWLLRLEGLDRIAESTLMLAVVGDADRVANDLGAREILRGATQVPRRNKALITLVSDDHPDPPLHAGHGAPRAADPVFLADLELDRGDLVGRGGRRRHGLSGGLRRERRSGDRRHGPASRTGDQDVEDDYRLTPPDALDYYGYWRLCDELLDAALRGADRKGLFDPTPQQRSMGVCSDGVPVKELIVHQDL